jgi:hypothetical protein
MIGIEFNHECSYVKPKTACEPPWPLAVKNNRREIQMSSQPEVAPWRMALVWIFRVFLFLCLVYVLWQILTPIIKGIEIGISLGAGGMG